MYDFVEGLVNSFLLKIKKSCWFYNRIKTEEMDKYNLKSPHVSCLYYLFLEKELTARDLCLICDEDKASISRSLEYLEKNEYVICETNEKKKYKSLITLTKKGEGIAREIVSKIDNYLEIASKGISEEERVNLYRCLNIINSNLEKCVKGEND